MVRITRSPKETMEFGVYLAKQLSGGEVIALSGELGSGKTVLVKGLALGLGIDPQEVSSPTFVLIKEYSEARLKLFHLDLYRLDSRHSGFLGIEECWEVSDRKRAVTVIEWAERAKDLLPPERLEIEIQSRGPQSREFCLTGHGEQYLRIIRNLTRSKEKK